MHKEPGVLILTFSCGLNLFGTIKASSTTRMYAHNSRAQSSNIYAKNLALKHTALIQACAHTSYNTQPTYTHSCTHKQHSTKALSTLHEHEHTQRVQTHSTHTHGTHQHTHTHTNKPSLPHLYTHPPCPTYTHTLPAPPTHTPSLPHLRIHPPCPTYTHTLPAPPTHAH